MSEVCSRCGRASLKWVTERLEFPVDVLRCEACGHAELVEDWTLPLRPMGPQSCTNCSDLVVDGRCRSCGLTVTDNQDVHNEMRDMVRPLASQWDAAQLARSRGRRLIALKLATSVLMIDEGGKRGPARAMRVELMHEIGEGAAALAEAKQWVERSSEPSPLAWDTLAQQLLLSGRGGEALETYQFAMERNPQQAYLRARRAEVMHAMGRLGQAHAEVCALWGAGAVEDAAAVVALRVADQLAQFYEEQERFSELALLLDAAGSYRDRSPVLGALQAMRLAREGDAAAASRILKRVRKAAPEHPFLAKAEAVVATHQRRWWQW